MTRMMVVFFNRAKTSIMNVAMLLTTTVIVMSIVTILMTMRMMLMTMRVMMMATAKITMSGSSAASAAPPQQRSRADSIRCHPLLSRMEATVPHTDPTTATNSEPYNSPPPA